MAGLEADLRPHGDQVRRPSKDDAAIRENVGLDRARDRDPRRRAARSSTGSTASARSTWTSSARRSSTCSRRTPQQAPVPEGGRRRVRRRGLRPERGDEGLAPRGLGWLRRGRREDRGEPDREGTDPFLQAHGHFLAAVVHRLRRDAAGATAALDAAAEARRRRRRPEGADHHRAGPRRPAIRRPHRPRARSSPTPRG